MQLPMQGISCVPARSQDTARNNRDVVKSLAMTKLFFERITLLRIHQESIDGTGRERV